LYSISIIFSNKYVADKNNEPPQYLMYGCYFLHIVFRS